MAQPNVPAVVPVAAPAAAPAPPAPAQPPRGAYHVQPEKYKGRLQDNFASWLMHFDQVAAVNNWNNVQETQFLGLALEGEAQLYYQSLPAATRNGGRQQLVQALQARFDPAQRVDLHRAAFQARRQAKDEQLGTFCEAVRSLARQAYPQMAAGDLDSLTKDQFISGLDSRGMRVRVRELNPQTTDGALQAALHHQAILAAELPAAEPVPIPAFAVSQPLDTVTDQLKAVLDRLATLEASLPGPIRRSRPDQLPQAPQTQGRTPVTCWSCGRQGHISRECRARRPAPAGNYRRQY